MINPRPMDDPADRVNRERLASDVDDVLANAYALKRRFSHCSESPTARRMEAEFESVLSDVKGKKVLEIGCGEGETALSLIRRGAAVFGIDISENYINAARNKLGELGDNNGRWDLRVMDAHELEFPDNSMDLVIGRGVLHHLDIGKAISEIHRVLIPGGLICFIEPLGGNPLLKLFRLLTPKARTLDERPLDNTDLALIEKLFTVKHKFYGLVSAPIAVATSLVLRPWPDNPPLRIADAIERKFNSLGIANSWNQYVLLMAAKSPNGDRPIENVSR